MNLSTTTPSDLQLLEAWRAGDLPAGAQLFERHYAGIARFFSNKVGSEREDLIQSTFLACLEGIDRFRGDASFRTLLFAIARFKLLKHLREQSRDHHYRDPAPPLLEADGPSPISLLTATTTRRRLHAALRRLTLDTQLMLELFYWEALPLKDIARILEIPINTVKTRLRRAREQLALELAAIDASPSDVESSLAGLDRWVEALRGRHAGIGRVVQEPMS